MYFLILTAPNEIYDDTGEEISLEKMEHAVIKHAIRVVPCNHLSQEEIITDFRKNPVSRFASIGALLILTSADSEFDPENFSIVSYHLFVVRPKITPTTQHFAHSSSNLNSTEPEESKTTSSVIL